MSWSKSFPDNIITQLPQPTDSSWDPFFEGQKDEMKEIYQVLSEELAERKTLLPLPADVYRAMNLVSLPDIRVLVLGQDPYHTIEKTSNGNSYIILATGLAFSIPAQAKIPSSLRNIYANLIKFGHIEKTGNGNLENWCSQGCLLLNTSLTVTQGNPNCHKFVWQEFTDQLIKYISDNTTGVVFMLWGKESLSKKTLIDETKHFCTISSHPSGFSYDKKMGAYDAFINTDHFGKANEYLKSVGKTPIKW